MDDLDERLLRLLEFDGRMPVKALAARLGVSRATVQARLARLKQDGAVQGFTVRLGGAAVLPVRALMLLGTDHDRPDRLLAAVRRIRGVSRVHTTNGEWDLIVEIGCADLATLDRLIDSMRTTTGVVRTQTLLLLSSYSPEG